MCSERVKDEIKLDIGFDMKFVHTQKMLLFRQHHVLFFAGFVELHDQDGEILHILSTTKQSSLSSWIYFDELSRKA